MWANLQYLGHRERSPSRVDHACRGDCRENIQSGWHWELPKETRTISVCFAEAIVMSCAAVGVSGGMCNCISSYTFQHCSAQRTITVQFIHGVSLVTMFSITHLISGIYCMVCTLCACNLSIFPSCRIRLPSPCLSPCKELCLFLTLSSL